MKVLLLVAVLVGAIALMIWSDIIPFRLVKVGPTPDASAQPSSPASTPVTPHRAEQATAEAARLYPTLTQKGSPLNVAFVALYEEAKRTNPESLASPEWPLTLARSAAASLGRPPANAPPPPEPAKPPIRLVGRVVQHVPGGGLLIECRPAPAVASRMASVGGGGGVYSGDEGDAFGTFVLRHHPKERSFADDDRINIYAHEDGMYQGATVLGATRTIRAYRYASEPQATKSPAPSAVKPLGSSLDKKPR